MKPTRSKRQSAPGQGELFGLDAVASVYKANPETSLTNDMLYGLVARTAGVPLSVLEERVPVGQSGQRHSLARRQIRWQQQTLKRLNVLERVKGERGVWRLTEAAKRELHAAKPGVKLLGYRTDLGVAIWGPSGDAFKRLDVPVTLVFTSPPFPLSRSRAYGNVGEREIVDFICETLEPVVDALAEDGSLCCNVSNDIFLKGTPARSTYVERLVLEICDRFSLSLMDRLIWENPSKMPGPLQWASVTRQQLNTAWEPILWFCKNPLKVKANNRRVLEPHRDRHLKLIQSGGEKRETNYGDGAYRLKVGSFGAETAGRIPRNIIKRGHRCAYGIQHRRAALELGLPPHGAGQPLSVPEFLIQFLTEPGDLVIDPFGGRGITGLAAEINNRRWMTGEINLEYVRGGAELFRGRPGFWLNPHIDRAFATGCAR
ncbi:site-specific DNA-methyltransferase [Pseudomonas sp. LS-2]|uniref:site-specific DNA-methyltransferase n=1 Tax=Pseudomonas sp. LS-2 TaxID=2315859 RepID=UPI000E72DD7F|nr:site-specific DNA-methyltransferase [Pseudomonas sp. LS-2]RJX80326.1 site-specific DNA-methyltransferase [Pseudomonas sp. LS-2]